MIDYPDPHNTPNTTTAARPVLLSLALLLALVSPAAADVIHVDVGGGGDYLTIQQGLNVAGLGDTVLVSPGVYTGPLNLMLDFGGSDKVLRSKDGAAMTHIDCAGYPGHNVFRLDGGETPACVIEGFTIENAEVYDLGGAIFLGSECSPSIIDCMFLKNTATSGGAMFCAGFSSPPVTGCRFQGNECVAGQGGACYGSDILFSDCEFIDNVSSDAGPCAVGDNLRFERCLFESNGGEVSGGAVECGGVSEFEDCRFTENSALYGGAVYARGTMSALRCTFDVNRASVQGGAVSSTGTAVSLTDCVFYGNTVWDHEFEGYGGAVYCDGQEVSISGCEFLGNSARGRGGALALYDCTGAVADCVFGENVGTIYEWIPRGGALYTQLPEPDPLLIDRCTFAYNEVESGTAGGIYCLGNYGPDIRRSVIAFSAGGVGVFCNTASPPSITHCCVYGNAGGDSLCGDYASNLFLDPEFCDASGDDFTVSGASPCLPAGNPWSEQLGALGMGCPPGTGLEEPGIGAGLALSVAGRNPFDDAARVIYSVRTRGVPLTVTVYSVSGRVVKVLHDGSAVSTGGVLEWDGTNESGERVAAGTYFCRATSGAESATAKVVLIR